MDVLNFRMMTIDNETAEELCDSHQEKGEKKIIVSIFTNNIAFSIECLKNKIFLEMLTISYTVSYQVSSKVLTELVCDPNHIF